MKPINQILVFSAIVAVLALFSGPFYATLFPSQAFKEERALLGNFADPDPRIKNVQRMLRDLGYRVGFLDGEMSRGLRSAIKDFQKRNNLEPHGRVDYKTLEEMQKRLDQIEGNQNSIDKSKKSKPYHDIKKVQTLLKAAGYYSGELDGRMGVLTVDAVKKFQEANDLKADGILGAKTWRKLKQFEKK